MDYGVLVMQKLTIMALPLTRNETINQIRLWPATLEKSKNSTISTHYSKHGSIFHTADLKFMPESCLNFWDSSTSSPDNVLAQQTEDLPCLVRLVLLLMKDTNCSTIIREDVKIPKKPENLTGSVNFPDPLLDILIQSKFDRIIPQGGNWDFFPFNCPSLH